MSPEFSAKREIEEIFFLLLFVNTGLGLHMCGKHNLIFFPLLKTFPAAEQMLKAYACLKMLTHLF